MSKHMKVTPISKPRPRFTLQGITASALKAKTFPPIQWIADGLIPEGLILFAGKPKLGKSWAVLDLEVTVAEGSQWLGQSTDQGAVAYLALKDNQRRLKDRLDMIRPQLGDDIPLELFTDCQRLNEGGIDALEYWPDNADNPKLVVIDTLAKVKPHKASGMSDYAADYEAVGSLHKLASDHRIAIIVVHHTRKADAEDVQDSISGSTGLTGAVDASIVLTRNSEGTILYGRGRDIPEFEKAVEFDAERCRWKMLGDPDAVFVSDTRQKILAAIGEGYDTPNKICDATGLMPPNVRKTLSRMAEKGQITKTEYGRYALSPPVTPVTVSQLDEGKCDSVTTVTPSLEDEIHNPDNWR